MHMIVGKKREKKEQRNFRSRCTCDVSGKEERMRGGRRRTTVSECEVPLCFLCSTCVSHSLVLLIDARQVCERKRENDSPSE